MTLRRVGSSLLAVGSELANSGDCCVACCPATTVSEVIDILEAGATSVSVTVPSDSILTDGSCSGDCENLAGSYSLPFISRVTDILRYGDTFTADLCGSGSSESYSVTVRVTGLPSGSSVAIVYSIVVDGVGVTDCHLVYSKLLPCQELFDTPKGLNPSVDEQTEGAKCYTQSGVGSQATVTM